MKKTKKITNAETLRGLLAIDEKYFEENEEHCLTENTRAYIKDVLSKSDDDFLINALFNKNLKSKIANTKK